MNESKQRVLSSARSYAYYRIMAIKGRATAAEVIDAYDALCLRVEAELGIVAEEYIDSKEDDLTIAYMKGYQDAKEKFSKIAMDSPITAGMQNSDDAKALSIHINSLIKRG